MTAEDFARAREHSRKMLLIIIAEQGESGYRPPVGKEEHFYLLKEAGLIEKVPWVEEERWRVTARGFRQAVQWDEER